MSFGVSRCKGYVGEKHCSNVVSKVLTCYTPSYQTIDKGVVSMMNCQDQKKSLVNKNTLAIIPEGAIIDMIEYQGIDSFAATGDFTVGIGELNGNMMVNLIQGGTSMIANDNVGGCRQFISEVETGENNKIRVAYNSNVNFFCSGGVHGGTLRVDIYYHIKPRSG